MDSSGGKASSQVLDKVLVVDDEEMILKLLEEVLSHEGYQVTTSPSSEEVVRLTSTKGFDLVILDVGLQGLNGWKLMKMIREASPEIPIVVMTGYPAEEVIRFAEEHAQGCLEKPFHLRELLEVVGRVLKDRLVHMGAATTAGPSSGERLSPAPVTTPLWPKGAS